VERQVYVSKGEEERNLLAGKTCEEESPMCSLTHTFHGVQNLLAETIVIVSKGKKGSTDR